MEPTSDVKPISDMEPKSDRRGNYALLMGFTTVVLLGFGALGIDIAYMSMANTQASAVADAASHAALLTFRSAPGGEGARQAEGVVAAQWVVDNNNVGFDGPGAMDTLEYGIFNSAIGTFAPGSSPANAARATVSRRNGNGIELFLAPILGYDRADIIQSSVTVANPREIVVVIDRSGSMLSGWPISGRTGTDFALEAFSRYMVDHRVPLDRLGATWFNQTGAWWDTLKYVEGNQGAIIAHWSTWDSIHIEPRWCTNQQSGIDPATAALVASGNDLAFKAIIVISDGNPTCGTGAAGFTSATANAWSQGIHVWTVAFGHAINDPLMESATRGLGTYEKTPSSVGLSAVMLKIAESIPVALVQ